MSTGGGAGGSDDTNESGGARRVQPARSAAATESKRGKRGGEMGAPPSFLEKLSDILNDAKLSEHIAWNKEGDGIGIKHVERFAAKVLPKYYKHSNYQSFVRQLNIYGFHKTRHDEHFVEFKHPNFRRGQRHLVGLIRRKPQSHTSAKHQKHEENVSTPEAVGILERLTAEMRRLCNRVTALEAQMWVMNDRYYTLKQESSALWRTVLEGDAGLRQKAVAAVMQLSLSSSELRLFPHQRHDSDDDMDLGGPPQPPPPPLRPGPLSSSLLLGRATSVPSSSTNVLSNPVRPPLPISNSITASSGRRFTGSNMTGHSAAGSSTAFERGAGTTTTASGAAVRSGNDSGEQASSPPPPPPTPATSAADQALSDDPLLGLAATSAPNVASRANAGVSLRRTTPISPGFWPKRSGQDSAARYVSRAEAANTGEVGSSRGRDGGSLLSRIPPSGDFPAAVAAAAEAAEFLTRGDVDGFRRDCLLAAARSVARNTGGGDSDDAGGDAGGGRGDDDGRGATASDMDLSSGVAELDLDQRSADLPSTTRGNGGHESSANVSGNDLSGKTAARRSIAAAACGGEAVDHRVAGDSGAGECRSPDEGAEEETNKRPLEGRQEDVQSSGAKSSRRRRSAAP